MEFLLRLCDASGRHLVVLTLGERDTAKNAIDLVFDLIANEAENLVKNGTLPEGQVDEMKALQQIIFDRDSQGLFIRDGVSFDANGVELNPDLPISNSFISASKEDKEYKRCELIVSGGYTASDEAQLGETSPVHQQGEGHRVTVDELANLMFLHQIAIGKHVDVTKDIPELTDVVARAEKAELIEIDVKRAGYKLTEKGKRRHDSFVEEAQNLIRKYDIYCDVDVDAAGMVHFDTNLGQDLRVPVFEKEGVDPFRARFLLGLNDGEFDHLDKWEELIEDTKWYDEIFRPIEQAPSIEDIGDAKLEHIIDRAKAKLRSSTY